MTCSSCKVNPPRAKQRTCGSCHKIYMRGWRKTSKARVAAQLAELKQLKTRRPARRA